jgi:TPR repeat protein
MNDTLNLDYDPNEDIIVPRKREREINPACLVLLVLALVLTAARLVAWYAADFSLEARAGRGEAKALYLLGKRSFENAGSMEEKHSAVTLIRAAADQGYARAQAGLGLLYENGLVVRKSYTEALKWFQLAAAQGLAVAQNEIGVMYAKGRGVDQDVKEAAKWCRLAAEQGSEIARENLELAELTNHKTLPQLTTRAHDSYGHVVVQKVESDGVTVLFVPVGGGLGVAKVRMESLPADLQELCKYATKQGQAPGSAYSQIGLASNTL